MALQIAQWNLELTLTSIPVNRAFSPIGSNSNLLLPTQKNVLIKKIALDGIYNTSGDICLSYYSLYFVFSDYNNQLINSNIPITTSPLQSLIPSIINLNKDNPYQNVNEIAGGLLFSNVVGLRNTIILNNSVNPITGKLIFLISIYYV